MRILLIGGAEEVPRLSTAKLIDRGHDVTAFVDTARAERFYEKAGADVVRGSIYNLADIEKALRGHEAVVFFGIDMPHVLLPKPADLEPFDRLRREGTRNLLAASLRLRTPFMVLVSSVVVYGDAGAKEVDESFPLAPPAPAQSFADMEGIVTEGIRFQGLKATILRSGMLYSAHTWHTRSLFSLLAAGKTPPLGGQHAYLSPLHAEDLAAAVAEAVVKAPARSVLNIADDDPLPLSELLAAAADALGVKRPGALPPFLLRLYMGKDLYKLLQTSCRASNKRAKELLGWKPRFPSAAERLKEEAAIWRRTYLEPRSETEKAEAHGETERE